VRQVNIAEGDVSDPAIACRGRMVDAVWTNGYRARYANSSDRGRSFVAGRRISTKHDDEVVGVDVARGPNGVVAVAWWNQNSDGYPDLIVNRVRVRISVDGGQTFGPPSTIGHGSVPSIAVGDGVIYVAYQDEDSNALLLRRTLDLGQSWRPIVTIAENTIDWPDVVAQGSEAYVGFTWGGLSERGVAYRHTANEGAIWSAPVRLGSKQGYGSSDVRLNLDGDIVQAAYLRCGDKHCNHFGRVMYRQSKDGVTWTTAEQVAAGDFFGRSSVGAAIFVGRPIVLYTESSSKTYGPKSRFRMP
jgi:hypothetical protein